MTTEQTKSNSKFKQIQELEQQLVILDYERNKIISQIEKLKKTQKTTKEYQKNTFTVEEKIALFRSLFRSREDVYAKLWQNKSGKSGYSPHCANEWKYGVCLKPRIKCSICKNRAYIPISNTIIEAHLRGKIVVGIYPLTEDEKCCFLAIDFDDAEWEKDVTAIRNFCQQINIPIAIERSRSGQGAHVWIFFEEAISACLARKMGSTILTQAMNKRHDISFKSYDRMFPNQDTMPIGGLGNLIALPLQAASRKNNNSVFIDECFLPYEDQWTFLSNVKKLSENSVCSLLNKLGIDNELGTLKTDKTDMEENQEPWLQTPPPLLKKKEHYNNMLEDYIGFMRVKKKFKFMII